MIPTPYFIVLFFCVKNIKTPADKECVPNLQTEGDPNDNMFRGFEKGFVQNGRNISGR